MMKDLIVIHHSLTKDSGSVSWNAIRRYHVNTKGWSDIGYHAGIEWVLDAAGEGHYEVLLGRPMNRDGAHAKGLNKQGLGFVFMGNFDDAPPSDAMLTYAAKHLRWMMDLMDIEPSDKTIVTHRSVASWKTCPGKLFPMDRLIGLLGS